jgi:hypothetical protein
VAIHGPKPQDPAELRAISPRSPGVTQHQVIAKLVQCFLGGDPDKFSQICVVDALGAPLQLAEFIADDAERGTRLCWQDLS